MFGFAAFLVGDHRRGAFEVTQLYPLKIDRVGRTAVMYLT